MKKIKRLRQLQKERHRLAARRMALEQEMQGDWQELRRSVAPATLFRHVLASGTDWVRQRWFNKKR